MQVVGFEKLHKRLKSFFYWCFFAKPSVNNKCLRLPLYANRVKSYLLHIKTGVILQHCHWQKNLQIPSSLISRIIVHMSKEPWQAEGTSKAKYLFLTNNLAYCPSLTLS
jgi:hypothetical protein